MSKKNTEPRLAEGVGYGAGKILQDHRFQYLEGRLLTIIETIGLSQSQETALKSLIRNEVWDTYQNGCYINSDEHTAIQFRREEERRKGMSIGDSYPIPTS